MRAVATTRSREARLWAAGERRMVQGAGHADARLPELDALRGIAAFLVLVHHAVQLIPRIRHPDIPGIGHLRYVLMEMTPLRIVEYGRGAVLFFFVLSGYVLTRALLQSGSPGLRAFAAQRTVRLGLPVAASVLLSTGLYFVFGDPNLPGFWRNHTLFTWLVPPTVGDVVRNALLIAGNDDLRLNVVLWSLVHEWRLTLLLPLVLLFRRRVALFAALAIAASWIGLMGGASENTVLLGPQIYNTFAATLYFVPSVGAGVTLALWYGAEAPVLRREHRLPAIIACVVLFGMASDLAVYAGSTLLIVLARQPWAFRNFLRTGPLLWLGGISFSLYLVHVPVLAATLHLLHDEWPPMLMALAGAFAALGTAVLFFQLVEEPARRLARRLERRLATPGWRQATAERRRVAAPTVRDWSPEGGMSATPR
jgi:peptidoglycan/LPS O-acetylase OafA/YrhL